MKNIKSFKEFLNQVDKLNERYEHDEDIKLIDNPEIAIYAKNGNLDKVKDLLNNGVNPDSKDKYGDTALVWASYKGYLDIVKELLRYNADVNIQDIDNETALGMASYKGYLDIVKELLKYNADTSIKDNEGKTAFDYATGKVKEYFISQGIIK